jgi:hypothetical protein
MGYSEKIALVVLQVVGIHWPERPTPSLSVWLFEAIEAGLPKRIGSDHHAVSAAIPEKGVPPKQSPDNDQDEQEIKNPVSQT